MKNNFGTEDPYFEQVPATRLDGRPTNKMKKQRKALPVGISEHDGKVLTKVKRRAHRLDMSLFSLCGIRFGWSSVIGILPGIGDALDAFMAFMVLRTCEQIEGGLPSEVRYKMVFNIILDGFLGLVPILGDLCDAAFKANTRNAVELEKLLRKRGAANLKAQGHTGVVTDPSDPDEYDRQLTADLGAPPGYTATPLNGQSNDVPSTGHVGPTEPPLVRVHDDHKGSGGFFSGLFGSTKQQDLERGTGNVQPGQTGQVRQPGPAPPQQPQGPQQSGTMRSYRPGH